MKLLTDHKINRGFTAVSILVIALIVITPLCGWLFGCGCTWPWSGLDAYCNIHDASAEFRCPWCASLWMGWLSGLIAVLAGVSAAIRSDSWFTERRIGTIGLEIILGVFVFASTAILLGVISAHLQHYPL